MKRRTFQTSYVLASLVGLVLGIAMPGLAQQGHPLTGTWNGDWASTPTQRTHITLVMNWDGKVVTGLMNPGPDSAPATVSVDVTSWNVRVEADLKDASGKPAHVVAEGKIDDLGSYHRWIAGTWRQGSASGAFKLTRD